MRRQEREIVNQEEILAILDRCGVVMRVAFSDEHTPYIVPLCFCYELQEDALVFYFHCANAGRKIDLLCKNPHVAFEVDRLVEMSLRDEACSCTATFESVIGSGKIEVLEATEAKNNALDRLVARCGHTGSPTYSEKMLEITTVLQLTVGEICGKQKP